MKKVWLVLTGMIFFLFTGCLSQKSNLNFDYTERAALGTPENSVIFIGFYATNYAMSWSQSDSEYPPDYQSLDGPFVISAPVAPGSRYRLSFVSGSYSVGNTTYWWSEYYSMQVNNFDIKIPDEPGIYYFGYYSGSDSYSNGKPVEAPQSVFTPSTNSPEKRELACLKEALNRYKGTDWEPVIKARMEELN